MLILNKSFALGAVLGALSLPVARAETPAPPNWQDGHGASVYLQNLAPAAAEPGTPADARYSAERPTAESIAPPPAVAAAPPKLDLAVQPAVHEAPDAAMPEVPSRRLAPPSARANAGEPQGPRAAATALRDVSFGIPAQSIYTIVTALAIVIGVFLIFSWALRRGSKKAGGRALLPSEVVSVLGRAPLAARQFAELLRVGNKLVLVAQSASGPTTITEVTDPAEVDRLVGLCQQFDPRSTTKAFEHVFQQLTSEPAGNGFLGNEGLPQSLSSAALAYRSHRGSSRV